MVIGRVTPAHPERPLIKTFLSRIVKDVIVGAQFEYEVTLMVGRDVDDDWYVRALFVGLGDDAGGIDAIGSLVWF